MMYQGVVIETREKRSIRQGGGNVERLSTSREVYVYARIAFDQIVYIHSGDKPEDEVFYTLQSAGVGRVTVCDTRKETKLAYEAYTTGKPMSEFLVAISSTPVEVYISQPIDHGAGGCSITLYPQPFYTPPPSPPFLLSSFLYDRIIKDTSIWRWEGDGPNGTRLSVAITEDDHHQVIYCLGGSTITVPHA